MNPRQAKRLMKKAGMNIEEVPDVLEVVIKTSDKEITIEDPNVTIMRMKNESMFQIMGGKVSENLLEKKLSIPEEDLQIVASQTGVSIKEAEEALKQTKGDLASAILLIQSRK
jgi:nascent polypeptide-associated complex subunit alpha